VQVTTRLATVATATVATVAALAAPSLSAPRARSAATPSTTQPAAAAAGYLARQLQGKHHDHYTITFGKTVYANYGETADAVLSMDAAGVAQGAAQRATSYLAKNVKAYAQGTPTWYPGPLAKLILVALAQHAHPKSFGGVNLISNLVASEGAGGAAPGEYQQNPGYGGTAYVVSQALPVLALAVAPGATHHPDAAAVSFLAEQQCGDGGYQSTVRDDTSTACSGEDVDSTAYAVQALFAAGAKHVAELGVRWLAKHEHKHGGFGSPANANSTALAVQALVVARRSVAAPVKWLEQHQIGCGGKAARRGAVVFEKSYDASALLATSQAGAALARMPLAWIDRDGATKAAPTLAC
jgi:hypothetical protein